MLRFDSSGVIPGSACEVTLHSEAHADPSLVEDTRITAFLDSVVKRIGTLPTAMHEEIRHELAQHLERLIAGHEELGVNREEATACAIRQFGDAGCIARRFRRAWAFTAACESPLPAMRLGIAAFGVAMLSLIGLISLFYLFLQYRSGGIAISGVVPVLFLALVFGLPLVAGVYICVRARRRAALGGFFALAALSLVTIPLLLAGQGDTDTSSLLGMFARQLCGFVGPCFVSWIPMGWLSILLTSLAKNLRAARLRA